MSRTFWLKRWRSMFYLGDATWNFIHWHPNVTEFKFKGSRVGLLRIRRDWIEKL